MGKKIIIAAMALIAVAVGLIIFISNRNSVTTDDKIAQASKYFEMMDYDKTIAIYNEILAADSSCEEAYIGLADAYTAKDNKDKAIEILERGVEAIGNNGKIADKIFELSDPKLLSGLDDNSSITALSESDTTTQIITEAVTTAVPETTTVTTTVPETTTEETTTTPETTTVTTTEETTTTPETTTVTTTEATTRATTVVTEKPTISVPNFIGISKEEAFKIADSKNIMLIFEHEKNDTYPNGVVFYQSSREGTMVAPSTPVYAYVCVNDQEYVSEDMQLVHDLYTEIEKWSNDNSDRISNLYLNEDTNTIVLSVSSFKRFFLPEDIVTAFRKCKNTKLEIIYSEFTLSINSSNVKSNAKLNLSSEYRGSNERAFFDISDGADDCTITVTLTACEIDSNDLKNMKLYDPKDKKSAIRLNADEQPVFTINAGGTYKIK